MIIIAILNFFIWLYAILANILSQDIKKELNTGKKWINILVFSLIGFIQLFRYQGYVSILLFISFFLVGLFISRIKSGLLKTGLLFNGRFYRYTKIKGVDYNLDGNEIRLIFHLNRHDAYAFLDRKEQDWVKDFVINFYKGKDLT